MLKPQTDDYAKFLIQKAAILASRWAGFNRSLSLKRISLADLHEVKKENIFLRERVQQLEAQVDALIAKDKRRGGKQRYPLHERLYIAFCVAYFQIPKAQLPNTFGVARSTFYQWMRKIDDRTRSKKRPHNKTPDDIAALVWEMADQYYKV